MSVGLLKSSLCVRITVTTIGSPAL